MKKIFFVLISVAILVLSSCQVKKCECTTSIKVGKGEMTTQDDIDLEEGQTCKDLEKEMLIGDVQGEVSCRPIF